MKKEKKTKKEIDKKYYLANREKCLEYAKQRYQIKKQLT